MLQTALRDCTYSGNGHEHNNNNNIVIIVYNLGPNGSSGAFDRITKVSGWKIARLFNIYPTKIASIHYCYDDIRIKRIVSLGSIILGSTIRARFRSKQGSPTEIVYDLMTYGISPDILPFATTGKFIYTNHNLFIKQQQVFDSNISNNATMFAEGDPQQQQRQHQQQRRVIVPQNSDILLKRGGQYHNHPGNARFHSIVNEHFQHYEESGKHEKKHVSQSIVNIIKYGESGKKVVMSRFLKLDDAGWIMISDDEARDRVAHAFRNKRLRESKMKKNAMATAAATAASVVQSTITTTTTTTTKASSLAARPITPASILSCTYSGGGGGNASDGDNNILGVRRRTRDLDNDGDGSSSSDYSDGTGGCFSLLPGVACKRRKKG